MQGGSYKVTNIFLHQMSPLCKLGWGGHNHERELNKLINFIKASIPLREDFTHEASTSKKVIPPKGRNLYMSLHAPRKKEKLRNAQRKGKKTHQHVTNFHALRRQATCNFCNKVGHIQWGRSGMPLSKREKPSGFQRRQCHRGLNSFLIL